MNNQEALQVLQTKYHIDGPIKEVCKELEAREVATEALKKQIPKKPLLSGNTNKLTGVIFICPSCREVVGIDDMKANYCADCGQKLDWEN